MRVLLPVFLFPLLVGLASAAEPATAPGAEKAVAPETAGPSVEARLSASPARVVVIPVREQIAKPILYVVRRGLKQAIESKADIVVLDMKTPGGALDVTFEIMEALGRFPGKTVTYVNDEAISAGAFISAVTGEIWFAPEGVIGAAAPVLATGGEIDASMKQKIVSYLRARVRAISEGKGYRGQVISAMIDADYELKIGDEVLKPKGELLSLTGSEAFKSYGDPPQPLLAAGIAKDLPALLAKLGATSESTTLLKTSWSEDAAVVLTNLSPILLGLGLLAAFIEFKTPGFGIFGVAAGILLSLVFFGHYIAGLSGHEPILFFLLGVAAVAVELLFFPGTVVLALAGILLVLGSLVWSMADIWPDQAIEFSGDLFLRPLGNLGVGLVFAFVGSLLLLRFLPRGWLWDRMVLSSAVTGVSGAAGTPTVGSPDPLLGAAGIAVTGLYPTGTVEINGTRHEAHLALGNAQPGDRVVVRGRREFALIVERLDP
jgi:membrane-bound serine protease (ClpP class)